MDTEIRKLTLAELRAKLRKRFENAEKIDPLTDPVPANRKQTETIRLIKRETFGNVEVDESAQF